MNNSITPTMQKAVEFANEHGGELTRHPGGFWAGPEFELHGKYFGTNTIHGLVTRGIAIYSEYKEGRNGSFPIKIKLNQLDTTL